MSSASRKPLIKTLRARLTFWYLLTLALTLGLFTALLYLSLSRTLYRHHDNELFEQAMGVADTLSGRRLSEAGIAGAIEGSRAASRFVMVRDNRGELLYRSPVLQFAEPNIGRHEALVHAAAHGARDPQFFTVVLERSGSVRFVCVPLNPESSAYLQLGNPLGDVPTTLESVVWASLGLVPLVLGLTSFGGWLIARRALAPMRSIDATLQAIQATDLSQRIETSPTDEELARLKTTLNQLLERLDRAFVSLREFAGDVSHQLQTPLTVMQGSVDEALRAEDRPNSDKRLLEDLAGEIHDMSAIVSGLRDLALADAASAGHERKPVDLSETVSEAVEIIGALGEARHVSVTSRIASGVVTRGDQTRLQQVVLNLGDNAVKYTPAGGQVAVDLSTEGDAAILRVTDSGSGIAAEHLRHVFERFYRIEPARSRADGTGLGLAIVKRIVETHRGTIEVQSRVGAGSTFTVRLPLIQ